MSDVRNQFGIEGVADFRPVECDGGHTIGDLYQDMIHFERFCLLKSGCSKGQYPGLGCVDAPEVVNADTAVSRNHADCFSLRADNARRGSCALCSGSVQSPSKLQ